VTVAEFWITELIPGASLALTLMKLTHEYLWKPAARRIERHRYGSESSGDNEESSRS
jgi:hypothetical protein